MLRPVLALTTLALVLSALPDPAEARSHVGRKMRDYTFVDLRGHEIRPRDYHGSVLVTYAGIPW